MQADHDALFEKARDDAPHAHTRRDMSTHSHPRRSDVLWSAAFFAAAAVLAAFSVLGWVTNTSSRPDDGYAVEMWGKCGVQISASQDGSDPMYVTTDTGLKDANGKQKCLRFAAGQSVSYDRDNRFISPESTTVTPPRLISVVVGAGAVVAAAIGVLFVWDTLPGWLRPNRRRPERLLP